MTYTPEQYAGGGKERTLHTNATHELSGEPGAYQRVQWPRGVFIRVGNSTGPQPAKVRLPDATGLQKGWPQTVLFLLPEGAEPTTFRLENHDASQYWEWGGGLLPLVITLGLVDNTTEGGLWVACAREWSYLDPTALPTVAAFCGGGGGYNYVDRYNLQTNTWSLETFSAGDYVDSSASFEGTFSLIRSTFRMFKYTGGLISLLSASGVAVERRCPLLRVSSSGIGTRHFYFGAKNISTPYTSVVDYFEYVTNTFTLVPTPSWVDWTNAVGSSSWSGTNKGCMVHARDGTEPPPSYSSNGYSNIFYTNGLTGTSSSVPFPPLYIGTAEASAEIGTSHHFFGGAYYDSDSNLLAVNSHQAVNKELGNTWTQRPNIPYPNYSHGAHSMNPSGDNPLLSTAIYYGHGRSTAFVNNTRTMVYTDATRTYAQLRLDAWTNRENMTNHWTRISV